jgi:hypothetical protein
MSIKVLYLFKAKLIYCLSIITKRDYLVRREVFILAGLVKLSFQDHKGWKTPARRADTLNCGHLLSVA